MPVRICNVNNAGTAECDDYDIIPAVYFGIPPRPNVENNQNDVYDSQGYLVITGSGDPDFVYPNYDNNAPHYSKLTKEQSEPKSTEHEYDNATEDVLVPAGEGPVCVSVVSVNENVEPCQAATSE